MWTRYQLVAFLPLILTLISLIRADSCDRSSVCEVWNSTLCSTANGCGCVCDSRRVSCNGSDIIIDLSHCGLKTISSLPQGPAPEWHITQLNLSNNDISSYRADMFRNLSSLQVLDLSGNLECYEYATFSPGVFEPLRNLRQLDLRLKLNTDTNKCDHGNFYLDDESIQSLSYNLTELHVTGSVKMVSLKDLSSLTILNLGGDRCNLTDHSNLADLQSLRLQRLSFRHCLYVYYVNGFQEAIRNTLYLDMSCTAVGLYSERVRWDTSTRFLTMLPSTLKVLLMDITLHTLVHTSENKALSPLPNITALSFSQYFQNVKTQLPPIDNTTFPNLRFLNQPYSEFNKSIIDFKKSGLKYLEYIDLSSSDSRVTEFKCQGQIHPWFLSDSKHIEAAYYEPDLGSQYTEAYQFPPRLHTIIAQDISSRFILDNLPPLSCGSSCQFAPNNLQKIDITCETTSCTKQTIECCTGGMEGLTEMKTVLGHGLDIRDASPNFVQYLLETFPNLTSMELTGSTGVDLSTLSETHDHLEYLRVDKLRNEGEETFPNNAFSLNLKKYFPNLLSITAARNSLKTINITIPGNLTHLDISKNDISVITNDEMLTELTDHAESHPSFDMDMRGNEVSCDCECESTNYAFAQWLVNSSQFVWFDDGNDCGNYGNISNCVRRRQIEMSCKKSTTGPSGSEMPNFAIGIITALVVVAALGVTGFFVWRQYKLRIETWFRGLYSNKENVIDVSNKFYLIYDERECYQELAGHISELASQYQLDIKSRFDIPIGESTNQAITENMERESSLKVIVMIPDSCFIGTEPYFNELLTVALHFRHREIHIVSTEGASYEDLLRWVEEKDPENKDVFKLFSTNFKNFLPSSLDIVDSECCAKEILEMLTIMLKPGENGAIVSGSNIPLVPVT